MGREGERGGKERRGRDREREGEGENGGRREKGREREGERERRGKGEGGREGGRGERRLKNESVVPKTLYYSLLGKLGFCLNK